jgi:hypothetical protein
VLLACAIQPAGCASVEMKDLDLAQETLPVPAERVRTAIVQVLQDGGYDVNGGEGEDRVLTTGYRQEMDSPANWMLTRGRFGTVRSRVAVTLSPEGDQATQLTIQVTHEGKDGLFESWKPYPTPLPQSAANQLRLVKNALGLLP